MGWVFFPYAILLLLTAGLTALVSITVWQRRPVPGSEPLSGLLMAAAVWCFSSGFEAAAPLLDDKILWSKISYFGIAASPPMFLLFVLEYSQQEHLIRRRRTFWLWIVPAVTLLMAVANEQHHLLWTVITFGPVISGPAVYGHGPYWWFNVLYSYSLIAVSLGLLVRLFFQSPALLRRQVALFIASSLTPVMGNVIYVLGFSPFPGFDPTPFAFALTGLLLALSILHYHAFDVVPIARHALIDNMPDGVIMLDAQERLVDINPAARQWLGLDPQATGKRASEVLKQWANFLVHSNGVEEVRTEMRLAEADTHHDFDVRITPLRNKQGQLKGRLIVFRDITEHKQTENALREANAILQSQLMEIEILETKLRDQAIHDPLTGLYNRRYLEEALEREIARADRDGTPVSIVIMDLDHFKHINDSFGHKAGDLMLKATAEMIRKQTRRGDVTCRFGGEEFVVVMPGAPLEIAHRRAEQWRSSMEKLVVEFESNYLMVRLSAGVATYPEQGKSAEDVLRFADQALYLAKSRGRNQVVVWEQESS